MEEKARGAAAVAEEEEEASLSLSIEKYPRRFSGREKKKNARLARRRLERVLAPLSLSLFAFSTTRPAEHRSARGAGRFLTAPIPSLPSTESSLSTALSLFC